MILLPVIDRELRVAARRVGTYRTRLGAGATATVLLAWANLVCYWQGASRTTVGQTLFNTVSGLAFVYCLIAGARVTADCISEEKREGTLGLLFLTDLKAWHVILGKFVASSLNSFYGLLSVVPLLAIPLLIGGVTFLQVGQMALVLVNTLFFSLSIGLLVSTLSRNDRKAIFATLLVVFISVTAPVMAVMFCIFVLDLIQSIADLEVIAHLLLPTPAAAFSYVVWPSFSRMRIAWTPPVASFWASVLTVHLLGWLALVVASRVLPAVWRVSSRTSKLASWTDRWRMISQGDRRQRWRTRLLERNPFLWLVARDRFKAGYGWLFLVGIILTWTWGYRSYRDVMFDFYPVIPTILLVHGFLKIWILSEASHRLVEDRRSGALEMLLCTPMSAAAIIRGQWLALRRQFAWPILAMGGIEMVVFYGWYSWTLVLCGLAMLVADALTLALLGMYLGLSGKTMNRVLWTACLWVLLMPWAVVVLGVALWHALLASGNHYGGLPFSFRVALWCGVGLVVDSLIVVLWAWPGLKRCFRSIDDEDERGMPVHSPSADWSRSPSAPVAGAAER